VSEHSDSVSSLRERRQSRAPGATLLPLLVLSASVAYADTAADLPSPAVPGQIQAQTVLTQGFSSAQIGNLSGHLQQLHQGFDPCASSGKLALTATAPSARRDNLSAEASSGGPRNSMPTAPSDTSAQKCLNDALFSSRQSALWFAGALNYGANLSTAAEHHYFTSPGLTVGIDHRLADRLIVGATLGRGWNDSTVDAAGSNTSSISTDGTVYLHYRPTYTMAVDALLGYGDVAMDNRRWIDSDSSWVRGSRHGTSWFGSLALTSAFEHSGFRFEPYLRNDFVASTLDSYSEAGVSDFTLGYGAACTSMDTVSAGAVAFHDISIAGDTLTPVFALQYVRTLNDSQASSLYYSNVGASTTYLLAGTTTPQFVTTRQFGLRYHNRHGLQSEVGANYSIANSYLSRSYMASVRAAF